MEDFFSRFTFGHTRQNSIDPKEKLESLWEKLLIEPNKDSNSLLHVKQTSIPQTLSHILDLLVKEQAANEGSSSNNSINNTTTATTSTTSTSSNFNFFGKQLESGCIEMFLEKDMITDLISLSETNEPEGYRSEVIRFLSNLVQLLSSKILIHKAFHRPIIHLIRYTLKYKDRRFDEEMIELVSNLVYKIKEFPELLNIFFIKNLHPRNVSTESFKAGRRDTTGKTLNLSPDRQPKPVSSSGSKDSEKEQNVTVENDVGHSMGDAKKNDEEDLEFLLFDFLILFLHLTDQLGDFARTAILFMIQAADPDIEEYILRSEFINIMMVGLVTFYTQLPHRLPIGLKFTNENKRSKNNTIQLNVFKKDLDAFLRMLVYLQDIMNKGSSPLTTVLLENIKASFLDNVLLNSIQNASDFDGSTESCLYYLQQSVQILNHSALQRLFAEFFLTSSDSDSADMRDVLLTKLTSMSEDVVIAALELLSSLISMNSYITLPLLFQRWEKVHGPKHKFMLSSNEYLSIFSRLCQFVPSHWFNDEEDPRLGFRAYLVDADELLSTHSASYYHDSFTANTYQSSLPVPPSSMKYSNTPKQASLTGSQLLTSSPNRQQLERIPTRSLESMQDTIMYFTKDSTLKKLLDKMDTFFGQTFDINMSLTTLVSLILSCPSPLTYLSLVGFPGSSNVMNNKSSWSKYDSELNICTLITVLEKLFQQIKQKAIIIVDYEDKILQVRSDLFVENQKKQQNNQNPIQTTFSRLFDFAAVVGSSNGSSNNIAGQGSFGMMNPNDGSRNENEEDIVDVETEYLKNVILLEEFCKEILAILTMHRFRSYDQIDYHHR